MFCKICGAECPDSAEFCTACGVKLEAEVAAPVEVAETPKKDGKGLGIASLILSIASIVCCGGGGPLAIAALIMGIISSKKAKKGSATAGIIISIISLVIGIITGAIFGFAYAASLSTSTPMFG